MKKIAAIALIPLLALTLSACSSDSSSNSSNNSSSSTSKKSSNKSSTTFTADSPVTWDHYQSILIDLNPSVSENRGDTVSEVEETLGKPTYIAKGSLYYWTDINSSFKASKVAVRFDNGHASSKYYLGLSLDQSKTVDKSKIDDIKLGTSYEETVNILGEPFEDDQTGANVNAEGITNATYLTDKSGKGVVLMFMDDELTSKLNVPHITD